MPIDSSEEVAAHSFFESLGFVVSRVATTSVRTPDFLVDGDQPGYAVEVKTRLDDPDYLRGLRAGATKVRSRSLGHDRWAQDIARSATKQLASLDPTHERHWILWIAVECYSSAAAMFDQAIGSLYGVRQVAYWDASCQQNVGRECLFVVPGVFERFPSLECAFVSGEGGVSFCINEFSLNDVRFRASRLYQELLGRGEPIRPSRLEASGGYWSVEDRSIDRSDLKAVEQYLARRYGVPTVHVIDVKSHSASVLVPRN